MSLPDHLPNILPNERTRDLLHSMFSSNKEYGGGYDYSSPHPARASSQERVDDGARSRHSNNRVIDVNTSLKTDEIMPWRFPERLINSLVTRQSSTIELYIFIQDIFMAYLPARATFVLKKTFISILFLKNRWCNGTRSVIGT